MIKKLAYFFIGLLTSFFANADTPAFSKEELTDNRSFSIPQNYEELSYQSLLDVLHPSASCYSQDFDMSKYRILLKLEVDGKEMIGLVCQPGTSFDSYATYLIIKEEGKTLAQPIRFLEPFYEDGLWKLKRTQLISGVIIVDQMSNHITNRVLYTGQGTCGFTAHYPLPLGDDVFLKPDFVQADDDCDNGVTLYDWPVIDVASMEVLDVPDY